jgi:hypothetical protein
MEKVLRAFQAQHWDEVKRGVNNVLESPESPSAPSCAEHVSLHQLIRARAPAARNAIRDTLTMKACILQHHHLIKSRYNTKHQKKAMDSICTAPKPTPTLHLMQPSPQNKPPAIPKEQVLYPQTHQRHADYVPHGLITKGNNEKRPSREPHPPRAVPLRTAHDGVPYPESAPGV